jgi:hypothetical protein
MEQPMCMWQQIHSRLNKRMKTMLKRRGLRESEGVLSVHVISTSEASIAVVSGHIDGQDYIWTGTSKRGPEDRPVLETGSKLALARAFENAAKQLNRQADGALKNHDDNRERRKVQKETPRDEERIKFYRLKKRARNRKNESTTN